MKDERLRVSFFGAVTSLCKVPTKGRNWWHQFLCLSDPSLVAGEPGHEAPPAEFKMHVFLPQVNTRNPTRNYSRIPLYHPRHTSSSRLYWPFSAGTEFSIIKPLDISASPSVISATLRVARGNCLPPVSFGSHRTPEFDIGSIFPIPQRRFAPFHANPPVPLVSPPPLFAAQPHRNICA